MTCTVRELNVSLSLKPVGHAASVTRISRKRLNYSYQNCLFWFKHFECYSQDTEETSFLRPPFLHLHSHHAGCSGVIYLSPTDVKRKDIICHLANIYKQNIISLFRIAIWMTEVMHIYIYVHHLFCSIFLYMHSFYSIGKIIFSILLNLPLQKGIWNRV